MLRIHEDIKEWHTKRYPNAQAVDIMLKFAEEAGEFVRAFQRLKNTDPADTEEYEKWLTNFREEAGDVGICLAAINRFYEVDPMESLMQRFYGEIVYR